MEVLDLMASVDQLYMRLWMQDQDMVWDMEESEDSEGQLLYQDAAAVSYEMIVIFLRQIVKRL